MYHKQAYPSRAYNRQGQTNRLTGNQGGQRRVRDGDRSSGRGDEAISTLQACFLAPGVLDSIWRGDSTWSPNHSGLTAWHTGLQDPDKSEARESRSGTQNWNSGESESKWELMEETQALELSNRCLAVVRAGSRWTEGGGAQWSAPGDKELANQGHRNVALGTVPKSSGQCEAFNFRVSPHTPPPSGAPRELKYLLLDSFLLGPRTALGQWAHLWGRQHWARVKGVTSSRKKGLAAHTCSQTSAAGLTDQILLEESILSSDHLY